MARSAKSADAPGEASASLASAPIMSPELPKPVHVLNYGNAHVKIFHKDDASSFFITAERVQRDRAGNERISSEFADSDLFTLAKAVTEARRWIEWQQHRAAEAATPPAMTGSH